MKKKNIGIDLFLLVILILLCVFHLWHEVYNGPSVSELVNFNTFSYVADKVLFAGTGLFSINKEIARVVPVESMPLCYPPGIYVITKLISTINSSHLAMNLFILLLQLINIIFMYCLLRKVSGRFISFSLALFFISFTSSSTIVVDTFIQPLLAIALFLLVSRTKTNNRIMLISCGILTGLVWFIRHNAGLFLSCAFITWLLLSCLSTAGKDLKAGRRFLFFAVLGYIICGLLLTRVIRPLDDKIWYLLCYLVFWLGFAKYIYTKKTVNLEVSRFIKDASLFILPLAAVISCWFFAFGKVIGLGRYIYIQYIMPFKFLDVFEYSILFHLNLAWKGLLQGLHNQGLRSLYGGFQTFLQWGVLFLLPFIFNLIFSGYAVLKISLKKTIDTFDLKMIALPIVGILMFYPVESRWIVSSKLILFFFPLAYFLNKIYLKKRVIVYAVSALFIILAAPRFFGLFLNYTTGKFAQRYATYAPVNDKENFRLPGDINVELKKSIDLINNTIGGSKFYVVDSYSDLEMYYGLTDYRHPNYYIFLRKDTMSSAANRDLIRRLRDYPYILINQKDYLSFTEDKNRYEKWERSIDPELMSYIMQNYAILASYKRPEEVKDIWLADFFIMKRK